MSKQLNVVLGEDKTRKSHKRYARTLIALLSNAEVGREKLDTIVGASNVPDVVMRLEDRFGLEIPCKRKESIDRDGLPCWPGFYRISEEYRAKAAALLRWMWSGGQGKFAWHDQLTFQLAGV